MLRPVPHVRSSSIRSLAVRGAYVVALTLAACAKPSSIEAPVESTRPTAPVAPGAPADLSKPDEVRIRLDLEQARSALRMHQQEQGGFPASLDTLSLKLHFPADLQYDAATGRVTSTTYPRL